MEAGGSTDRGAQLARATRSSQMLDILCRCHVWLWGRTHAKFFTTPDAAHTSQ